MKSIILAASFSLATTTLMTAASAEEGGKDATTGKSVPREGAGPLAGATVGATLPFGGLGPNIVGGIELGVVFPWLHRSFAFVGYLDYTAPKKSGTEMDPRITGGSYSWHLTEQELAFTPAAMFRLTSLGRVTPFIAVGPRFYFLQGTTRSGDTGPTINETVEKGTKVGLGIPLGTEIQLGPGGVLVELMLHYGSVDHTSTGASNTAGLNLGVGYRFLL